MPGDWPAERGLFLARAEAFVSQLRLAAVAGRSGMAKGCLEAGLRLSRPRERSTRLPGLEIQRFVQHFHDLVGRKRLCKQVTLGEPAAELL